MLSIGELNPPQRVLLGPGPSNVHPRVYRALATPIIGHLDPEFLEIMDDIQELLRYVFKTENAFTIAVSGTGSAGMQAAVTNVVEPGDAVLVGVNGYFGTRISDMVRRCGGKPIEIKTAWGEMVPPDRVLDELQKRPDLKAVAFVHAETSTGVRQPLEEIGAACKDRDTVFIVDAVTSLGGIPVKVDEWHIDVCYSGTQKCLSCPPGLAPITFSDKAMQVLKRRESKVQSWYLDMSLIASYWSDEQRAYHHTAPISMNYALREALRLVFAEGLQNRFQRHQENSQALIQGLQELGVEPLVDENYRLPTLNAVKVPPKVDEANIRRKLLDRYGIEIGGGLGELGGKIWRIGLMGESSQKANVVYLLAALEELLK